MRTDGEMVRHRKIGKQTDRQSYSQIVRQIDNHTVRQSDSQKVRQSDSQTDIDR